ncbi:alpha-ketoacid dehydrogenase subunit alpha/beta [Chitinophaga sancti]|uniref:2-oxoisovalerate dehydrogenase E1 component n=1 Tax=Chitinophaga sancti TaxID=1004 RepID=A0A1K1SY39_9BACT|nr:alpha-ketoacid dehydrogenase subunit alpha/beta [Chitinophaga sancti]WQD60513.1 thiamine pyrophosphate-dependent enzyme [Chitinophaga sancti]WQG87360.1 thiamine pyrophosphate-dependent enzyme [Chitinophaga sancti]SFW89250.1 2-oxoisovalerate dehydrogenase E1 component [Chitinophaga sancti]
MYFDRTHISDDELRAFYKALLYPRLVEEKMLLLLRQGKVSKWFSGIGQEAIAVGATLALDEDEWILPLHRNLGVFTTRQMPLQQLFHQWQGSSLGYTKGRERSFHFGSRQHHILGMISHLGPQLSVADGIAMALQMEGEGKVALAFTGEGGTSEGEFHEALNVAAVWGLPVVFLVENNGYGLSTPVTEQFRCDQLVDKAAGYGIRGMRIDGNNILEVYHAVQEAKRHALQEKQPVLIEAVTFRMRGHEEASGIKYVPPALLDYWAQRDPILHFEQFLQYLNLLDASLRESLKQEIDQDIQTALQEQVPAFNLDEELADIYAPAPAPVAPTGAVSEKRFINAIADALHQAMDLHPELILMGQDIAEYGGAFKITEGLVALYGKERVRNTPLCESAIIGAGLGLSVMGYRSMVEMQFADFVSCGFNQIVNNLAKIHYRWGQNANVVVRLPAGGGVGAGPFHSQTNEAWFTHTPGLKVVYPATPEDAKGLLLAALADPNPVLFFEHKALYRSISGPVPDAPYTIEIGKAKVVMEGDDLSIITYGAGVHWALEYALQHPELSLHILDLRSLQPLDYSAIREAVLSTGKVLILHEASLTGGFGGEIAAWISEHCFQLLDAPVMRCASQDTPVPFAAELEAHFQAKSRLHESVQRLVQY